MFNLMICLFLICGLLKILGVITTSWIILSLICFFPLLLGLSFLFLGFIIVFCVLILAYLSALVYDEYSMLLEKVRRKNEKSNK